MPAVVIAASNLIPPLREQVSEEGEIVTFTDTQPIQALEAILEMRPPLIVLERLFAATPRGAALINRIKTDPQLAQCEIRVMSHTGDYLRQVSRPVPTPPVGASEVIVEAAAAASAPAPVASAALAGAAGRALDWHGTRRAVRHRLQAGVEIQLDGNPASVIDISVLGAQVLSTTILRPNQKVRVSIPQDDALLRCRGTVAWAKFELPNPTAPPVYRAGVEFLDADHTALDAFAERNAAAD